jgi:exonuclease III
MNKDAIEQLQNLSDYLSQQAKPHESLLDIAKRVDEMILCAQETKSNPKKLRELALGLGMYISYDFEFSESETGTKILNVINLITRQTKKSE